MFRFLTFPPFCYVIIRKKDEFASILTAWFYFVFPKNSMFQLENMCTSVLGHFGHGHFGLGRFGLDISATDVSAWENAEGGRFGHNHKFWVWDMCMHKSVMHFIIF